MRKRYYWLIEKIRLIRQTKYGYKTNKQFKLPPKRKFWVLDGPRTWRDVWPRFHVHVPSRAAAHASHCVDQSSGLNFKICTDTYI
jgi:hypothetical protein